MELLKSLKIKNFLPEVAFVRRVDKTIIGFVRNACTIMLFIFLLFGCKPEYLDKEGLIAYISDADNGLIKTQTIGGTEVSISYKPADLLILQENGWKPEISSEKYMALRDKYEHHYYFTLTLSKNNKEIVNVADVGLGNFSSLVETLSFRMGEFTNVTTPKDTIAVADYVFSHTYGMSNANTLLYVFPKDRISDDGWVQFNLKEFGLGLGNLSFRFDTNNLNSIPKIEFTELL